MLQISTAWVHIWTVQLLKPTQPEKLNPRYCKLDKDADMENYSADDAEVIQVVFEDFLD